MGLDGLPVLQREMDDVGEVQLGLRVGRLEAGQDRAQEGGVEDVEAGVDLGDEEVVLLGVTRLDDAAHAPAGAAQDAPVVHRVRQHGRGHRGPGAPGAMRVDEPAEELTVDERHVAHEHQDVTLERG